MRQKDTLGSLDSDEYLARFNIHPTKFYVFSDGVKRNSNKAGVLNTEPFRMGTLVEIVERNELAACTL